MSTEALLTPATIGLRPKTMSTQTCSYPHNRIDPPKCGLNSISYAIIEFFRAVPTEALVWQNR